MNDSSFVQDDKPRLLVVEDDIENQKLIEIYLKRKFLINVCDSEDTFYEQLKNYKFDIFLVDISLRGRKDGLQLVQELRASDLYCKAPILCISAHVFPKDRTNAFNAGVDEFITKPVRNEDMLKCLIEVYNRKNGKTLL